ncbi:MAG TPA: hypothetical protein VHV74_12700 [Pseudonocardiaceae bacterium]|jgi:hypothetical protein|nr:hypothetical protein [Pseudonocardiaceae bacterium]
MGDIGERLRQLMDLGFRFVHPRDSCGHVVAVTGIRTHHGVIDVFQLYGERDADAARMSNTEQDVLSPRSPLWRTSGTPESVIDELLVLPDPRAVARQDEQRDGCWVATRPGHSTWLSATA